MRQTPAKQVAGTVRAELARHKITGRALARELGWSFSTTARRLNGSTPFDIDELVAIALFLGIPVSEFLPAESERVPA